jgi:hypothetical protein
MKPDLAPPYPTHLSDAVTVCVCVCVKPFITDICVPISHLPEVIVQTKEDIMKSSLVGTQLMLGLLCLRRALKLSLYIYACFRVRVNIHMYKQVYVCVCVCVCV